VWNVATGKPITPPLIPTLPIQHVAFSPDGQHLLTCGADAEARRGETCLWSLARGKVVMRFPKQTQNLLWAGFNADGSRVLTVNRFHNARVWNTATGAPLGEPVGPGRSLERAFTPDGKRVLTVSRSTARIQDPTGSQATLVSFSHHGDIQLAAFSGDGRVVFTSSADRTARVWNAMTGQPITPPLPQFQRVTRVRFNATGSRVLVIGDGNIGRVWDLAANERTLPIVRLKGSENCLTCAPDGRHVLRIKGGGAQVCEAGTDRSIGPILKHAHPVKHGAFSPNGKYVATADRETIRVWETATGRAVTGPLWHGEKVRRICFAPGGEHVAVIGRPTVVRLWQVPSGRSVLEQPSPLRSRQILNPVCLSPDGQHILVIRAPLQVDIRNLATGTPVVERLQHTAQVTASAFSPDGRLLATGCADGSAVVWDARTGKPIGPLAQHVRSVTHLTFRLDGRCLATADAEGRARVWESSTGLPVTPPLDHGEPLRQVRFSADGRNLVTLTQGGALHVWNLAPDRRPAADLVSLAQVLAGRRLDARSGGLVPLEMGRFRELWSRLRTLYPGTFPAR
jgi:WD40 repeat protein